MSEKIVLREITYEQMSTLVTELQTNNFVKDKEIERLNKLISQREKKWGKWTTEKTILSTKMSDYLCKYQNIKREYTKQIKISTDRKNEIERLNNIIEIMEKYFELILNLGYDYDGLNEKESLKNLIDELCRYASLGRAYNTTEIIYVNKDKKYNILGEELKGSDKE